MTYFITSDPDYNDFGVDLKPCSIDFAKSYLRSCSTINLDLEVEGNMGFFPQKNKAVLAAIGDGTYQFVIDMLTVAIKEFKEIIENSELIIFNAFYDLRFLYYHSIIPTKVYDPFLVECLIHAGNKLIRKGYAPVVKRYLNLELSKAERENITLTNYKRKGLIVYAGDDVKYLEAIKEQQLEIVKELKIENLVKLENNFVRVLAYKGYYGIKGDVEPLQKLTKTNEVELLKLEQKLNSFIPDLYRDSEENTLFPVYPTINWGSPDQVVQVLEKTGLDCTHFDTKAKKYRKTSSDGFLKQHSKHHPIINLIREYRKYAKKVSTYGYNLIDNITYFPDHRLRTQYNQILSSGRISSGGKQVLDGRKRSLTNLQNFPRLPEFRSCLIADEGNSFVIADYSQQESRILADFSNDPELIQVVGEGDMHCEITRIIYKKVKDLTNDEIKDNHDDKRTKAKAVTFSIPYGGNEFTISTHLGCSIEEGRRIYNEVLDMFPGMKKYFDTTKEFAFKNRYILFNTITNRRFTFDYSAQMDEKKGKLIEFVPEEYFEKHGDSEFRGLPNAFWKYRKDLRKKKDPYLEKVNSVYKGFKYFYSEMEKEALNYPIQGTGADMTKLAAIFLFDWILKNNLFGVVLIPNLVHDEIVAECPDKMAPKLAPLLKFFMEKAAKVFCKNIEIPAQPKITKKCVK